MRSFFELFLLPGIAAVLPWPLCFRLFRRAARCSYLYPEVDHLVDNARTVQTMQDVQAWAAACRFTRIFMVADLYLSMFRSDRWLDKYVDVEGEWPESPFLALTFHWGAGMWALRHLRATGKRTAFLSLRYDRGTFNHALIRYWYALLRTRETERAGGKPVIYTGGSSANIRQALQDNTCVAALLDVPPGEHQSALPVELFGRRAYFPRGLTRLATQENIPIVVFAMNLNRESGRLKLTIKRPLATNDETKLMESLASEFRVLLGQDSPAWHGWGHVQLYFEGRRV